MIPFKSLIAAIQTAVDAAAKAVSDENFKILRTYFNETPSAKGTTTGSDGNTQGLDQSDVSQLTPRMVALKYPKDTPQGPAEHTVYVPLISLTPMSSLHLSEIQMEIDLEVLEHGDEISVGFPSQKNTWLGGTKTLAPAPNAKIKITISAGDRAPGVSAVIEGYDKALRAQIPH